MKSKTIQFCAIIASVAVLDGSIGGPILQASEITFQRIIQTQTTFIQHEATERQRKIAQERAQVYERKFQASIKHMEPKKQAEVIQKRKKTRYIAVDTEKNEQTSPKAKKVVMVWDTQSESLVGNKVYDLESPPAVGNSIVFTTYAAEYVGGSN
jgi:hypothetical protein